MPGHIYCRQRNSGEAALVGGDNLFGRCSPAEQPLTVGRRQLRRVGCSSELALRRGGQLRGANVGRRIPFRGDIFTRLIESGTFLADDVIQYQLSIGVSWNARDNRREYWKLPIKK